MKGLFQLFVLTVAVGIATAGCSSSPKGAGAGKYAAVEVSGFSRMAVEMATEQVFTEDGFKMASKSNESLVFERPSNTTQNIVWGGWQTGLWERVVVKITRLGEDDHFLVSADAFRVQSKDDRILEEEKKMGFAVQATYQKLLERVKSLLAPMPTTPGAGDSTKANPSAKNGQRSA